MSFESRWHIRWDNDLEDEWEYWQNELAFAKEIGVAEANEIRAILKEIERRLNNEL